MEGFKNEPINSTEVGIYSNHLKVGVPPIMASIGTPDQLEEFPGEEKIVFDNIDQNNRNINNQNVNYFEDPETLTRNNFRNGSYRSYVISPINNFNKFSNKFRNCTGVIAAGIDADTGEHLSFMSHQDPWYFLDPDGIDNFVFDFDESLSELKKKSEPGTIDVAVVGGNYITTKDEHVRDYIDSIRLLSWEIQHVLGFDPIIITGPKLIGGDDHVYYDNSKRRLYIIRSEVGKSSTKSYYPNEITDQEKGWNS